MSADKLIVAGHKFSSRLIIGTGKYKDYAQNAAALEASGADMVTVAVRRAVRTLRLAKEAGGWNLVKLEVLSDPKHLYPDMEETLRAAELLIKDGFEVMVYCSDDPVFARKLEDIGCAAIMPLGAPIGSGLGIQNPVNIRLIVEQTKVPVIVDAGVGTASDATVAMELGCDGVLMNTAIAEAKDPIQMAPKFTFGRPYLAHKKGCLFPSSLKVVQCVNCFYNFRVSFLWNVNCVSHVSL